MSGTRDAFLMLLLCTVSVKVSGQESETSVESVAEGEEAVGTKGNDSTADASTGSTTAAASAAGSKVECDIRTTTELDDEKPAKVQLVNSSEILEFLDSVPNTTRSRCTVVLFYYPSCVFSCKAAPHFNALGRLFPQIHVLALDAYSHNGINMRFGLVGVPTILFFHNTKIVAKFNDSDPTIENLVSFVNRVTGLSPAGPGTLEITEQDRAGPVPSVVEHRVDYVLILSWLFVILCACHFVIKSTVFKRLTEYVRNNWREAEAQHEHQE